MSELPHNKQPGFAVIDLWVMEFPDTDLWALMAVLNMHNKNLSAGIKISQIQKDTGWSRAKTTKVLKRAMNKNILVALSNGRGLRVFRCHGGYRGGGND